MARRELVIDTCCTLNLLATKRELEIVQALGIRLLQTLQSSAEIISLSSPPDGEGRRGREPVSTAALQAADLLVIRALDTDALGRALLLAAERLDETDASCVALAGVLGVPLVTDDRRERRVASELFPAVGLVSTLDLLHDASGVLGWDEDELASVAMNLRWRGNFAPPRQDPRGAWYESLLRRAGVDGS
jgi:predicted nucleic acid-binding protein